MVISFLKDNYDTSIVESKEIRNTFSEEKCQIYYNQIENSDSNFSSLTKMYKNWNLVL